MPAITKHDDWNAYKNNSKDGYLFDDAWKVSYREDAKKLLEEVHKIEKELEKVCNSNYDKMLEEKYTLVWLREENEKKEKEFFKKYQAEIDKFIENSKPILSQKQKQDLKEVQIDPGQNFLSGKKTNTLTASKALLDGSIRTLSGSVGVVGSVASAAALMPDVISSALTYTTNLFGSYLAEVSAYFVSIPIKYNAYVVQRTSYWFNESLINPSEEWAKLSSERDMLSELESKNKKDEEKKKKDVTNKTAEKLADFQKKVEEKTNEIYLKCKDISEHIEEGPDYIEKELKNCIYKGYKSTYEYIGKEIEKMNIDITRKAELTGHKAGLALASPVNSTAVWALKVANDTLNREREEKLQKAKTEAAKATSILKAALGI